MLDIRLIRETSDFVEKNLKKRNDPQNLKLLKNIIELDKKRRELIKNSESLKKKRNEVTKEISILKRDKKNAEKNLEEARSISNKITEIDKELGSIEKETKETLMKIPNILHDSVPSGKDESGNIVVKKVGKLLKFSFEPKSHVEILENLGMLDMERAAKVAGHGFYYLKGDAVLLDFALQKFALDNLRKKGFILIEPPLMLNEENFMRVTDWEMFNNQAYKIEGENLRTIGTSEHPIGSMLSDEVILEKDLPLSFAGVSPCFRKEVGSHGKYTKGLFRVHHFNKVEQFVFCVPEDSWEWHEKIQKNSEELYKKLGIVYRVVNVCTGDIGTIAAKKYDIEFLMADGQYREIGSNSNCTDYQARRLGIRYREKEGMPAKGFVHTLNNTALATSRIIIAIVEQFQEKDGSVKIPKVLQPYTGVKKLEKA